MLCGSQSMVHSLQGPTDQGRCTELVLDQGGTTELEPASGWPGDSDCQASVRSPKPDNQPLVLPTWAQRIRCKRGSCIWQTFSQILNQLASTTKPDVMCQLQYGATQCAGEHTGPYAETQKPLKPYYIVVRNACIGLASQAIDLMNPSRANLHGILSRSQSCLAAPSCHGAIVSLLQQSCLTP